MKIETFSDKLYKIFSQEFSGNESLDPYIEKVKRKENLSPEEAVMAMRILTSGEASESQQSTFLTAMHSKKETVDEIAAFAYTLRKLAEPVKVISEATFGDTCGTGGGTLETFNISTTIMFILASAGIVIAKHGNRSITSKCGSADVLEELGVNINLDSQRVAKCISEIGIGFIFAPKFHKAFKNVGSVRKKLGALGIPTIFNILGPLSNPVFGASELKAYSQILGVNRPELTEPMAEVLKRLQAARAIVAYGFNDAGEKGMDELSTIGKTKISELKEGGVIDNYFLEPEQFGLKRAKPDDLSGGDCKENAKILIDILQGKDKGPKRDIVLLNAAAGLYVGGKAENIKEGIKLASQQIDSLGAYKKLEELINFSK